MVDLGLEAQRRRFERVLCGEAEVQIEDAALQIVSKRILARAAVSQKLGRETAYLVRRALGTVDEYLPLVYVCLGR